jgi:hypothetical protein
LEPLVTSLAVAVVTFLAGRSWQSFLRPRIENLWYKGLRLAPFYVGDFTLEGEKKNDFIEVKQKAHRVWGRMTFPSGGQGYYNFEATILDNVLRGTYEGVRLNPYARGSFLLVNTPGQRHLEGWFVEPYKGTVLAAQYKWTPKQD